jgi:N utilization substance protein A
MNDRIRATIIDVKKSGNRVKVFLSRIRPALVQRLFEQEIPEIVDGVIEIKAIAREAGYRTKIAVYSSDQRIDCVGACVGVRGSRVKPIGSELGDERIDVVPWDEDLLIFIPNALKPAEVEEVILCGMLGRAIVLVQQDQRSLAIGRKGQNVRLASKLCGWDIEIMSRDDLESMLEKALVGFSDIDGVDEELADRLVGEGFLTYDDLSIIEPDDLMEMGELSEEQVEKIVEEAERRAEAEEIAEAEAKVSAAEATEPEVPVAEAAPEAEPSAELAEPRDMEPVDLPTETPEAVGGTEPETPAESPSEENQAEESEEESGEGNEEELP